MFKPSNIYESYVEDHDGFCNGWAFEGEIKKCLLGWEPLVSFPRSLGLQQLQKYRSIDEQEITDSWLMHLRGRIFGSINDDWMFMVIQLQRLWKIRCVI